MQSSDELAGFYYKFVLFGLKETFIIPSTSDAVKFAPLLLLLFVCHTIKDF